MALTRQTYLANLHNFAKIDGECWIRLILRSACGVQVAINTIVGTKLLLLCA